MAKRTIKISIKLPAGVTATAALEAKAKAAALAVIKSATKDMVALQKIAKDLSSKGISITPQELLARKKGSSTTKTAVKTKSATVRKRVVLTPAQKKAMIAELKAGAKTAVMVKKYGVSIATVMNIKTAAKLTKKRKK
ncbi:MAG: hypothetical protein GWO81_03600 [Verrucomicrobia bacterium]|nr:hypothetical protein [Verrucomicrobiota bacterium]